MTHYLLSIYQPDGGPPAPEILDRVMRDLAELNAEIRSAGAWVFSAGLQPPDTATVVRATGDVLATDGPYLEGKEHVGGFWVIDVAERDAALEWARRASRATSLPIEVRPFAFPVG